MSGDERKSRLHVHLGGLIIIVIIILIIFKVDLKSKIQSPVFQKNVTYIEEQVKGFWTKYIAEPIKEKFGTVFVDVTNSFVKKIQDNVTKNLLKDNGETQN